MQLQDSHNPSNARPAGHVRPMQFMVWPAKATKGRTQNSINLKQPDF